MNRKNIENTIETLQADAASIVDPKTKNVLGGLLNLVEALYADNGKLKEENQQLKDENNKLKGEQGKPNVKGKNRRDNTDHSSEAERNKNDSSKGEDKKKRNRKPKLPDIKVDRELKCSIDKSILPEDAIYKGFTDVVIQDIKITTDNVRYRRETYYSPSLGKTFLGELPPDVAGKGEFGVGVRSLLPVLLSECNMSESCSLSFFRNFGIRMSTAYISNQWTKGYPEFHQEKTDIFLAGLSAGSYQQIDDTGARVNGANHHTHVICNPLYSAYFTTERKDRLTILDLFMNFAPRQFIYNQQAISLLETFKLSKKLRLEVGNVLDVTEELAENSVFDEATFDGLLTKIIVGPTLRTRIKEACAIAAYHQQTAIPVIENLVCDDAPQFKLLTKNVFLCWVHDGRHYKKLLPVIPHHQSILQEFITQYWAFYHKLKNYKEEGPNPDKVTQLTKEFDELFATKTDYEQLNMRIAKTLAKRTELLLALQHPQVPLHNNDSELGARAQVRARDVCLHTKSDAGTQIKDTFMTIVQTAKKLGVRVHEYVRDRVSGEFKLPSLAQIINGKNQKIGLNTC